MEELVEAIDTRGLLVSIVHRESRDIKKNKNDLESAIESTLLRYGWSERDVNFVAGAEGSSYADDIGEAVAKSADEVASYRESLRQARAEELASIRTLLLLYFPEETMNYGTETNVLRSE